MTSGIEFLVLGHGNIIQVVNMHYFVKKVVYGLKVKKYTD